MDQQPKRVRRHVSKFVDLHITLRGEAQVMYYQFKVTDRTADAIRERVLRPLTDSGRPRHHSFEHFCKNGLPARAVVDVGLISTITEYRHYTDEEK